MPFKNHLNINLVLINKLKIKDLHNRCKRKTQIKLLNKSLLPNSKKFLERIIKKSQILNIKLSITANKIMFK